jgi:hypothetical protein
LIVMAMLAGGAASGFFGKPAPAPTRSDSAGRQVADWIKAVG